MYIPTYSSPLACLRNEMIFQIEIHPPRYLLRCIHCIALLVMYIFRTFFYSNVNLIIKGKGMYAPVASILRF